MATKRKTNRTNSRKVQVRRKSTARRRSSNTPDHVGRLVLPAIVIVVMLSVIGYLAVQGYRVATVSDFFALQKVDVRGNDRTPVDEVDRVVRSMAEKPGVWNADLSDIRSRIEKFPFVETASVSKVLPSGIRVDINEKTPAAVVKLSHGEYLVDSDGEIIIPVTQKEKNFPIALLGWDEAKTEKAIPENLARLKMYKKMLEEWKQFDLAEKVKEVNLANTRVPVVVVEDSGRAVSVTLAKDNLGKSLRTAIEAISGKGAKIKSIDVGGVSPVIQYLEF